MVLAHSVVYFKRQEMPVEMFCQDKKAPSTSNSARDLVASLENYLPRLNELYSQQILPMEQAQHDASAQMAPQQYQLLTDMLSQFGPQLAEAGSQMDGAVRRSTSQTDLDLLRGSGGQLVREADQLGRQINPEFYNTRANASERANQLLGAVNLDNPNIEAERFINQENVRSGNSSALGGINTVSNALKFGQSERDRMGALSNAINTATNFLTGSHSPGQMGPANVLGQAGDNAGTAHFSGISSPTNMGVSMGQDFLGNLTGLRGQEMGINANRRDWIDRVNEGFSAI